MTKDEENHAPPSHQPRKRLLQYLRTHFAPVPYVPLTNLYPLRPKPVGRGDHYPLRLERLSFGQVKTGFVRPLLSDGEVEHQDIDVVAFDLLADLHWTALVGVVKEGQVRPLGVKFLSRS